MNEEKYNVCHVCQLAGMRNCAEFDKCGNVKSYPVELRHLIEANHINDIHISITAEQAYDLAKQDDWVSVGKYNEVKHDADIMFDALFDIISKDEIDNLDKCMTVASGAINSIIDKTRKDTPTK